MYQKSWSDNARFLRYGARWQWDQDPGIRFPQQSLKVGPKTPLKVKSGTPGPPPKFKSGTLIILFLHCLTYYVLDKYIIYYIIYYIILYYIIYYIILYYIILYYIILYYIYICIYMYIYKIEKTTSYFHRTFWIALNFNFKIGELYTTWNVIASKQGQNKWSVYTDSWYIYTYK